MPAVPYTPYQTTSPEVNPTGSMNIHATPEAFGSQVSQEEQKAGDVALQIAQKQQGIVNENNMMAGDLTLAQKLGALHGQYMSLSGQQAFDQKDAYVAAANQTVQDIRGTLHGQEAVHGFDSLAARRMTYLTQDWESHAATQLKQSNETLNLSTLDAAKASAGDPNIALNDQKFGEFVTGPIKYHAAAALDTDQPGFTTDTETGRTNFSDDEIGKNTKENFQRNLDHFLGQAYIQRYDTISKALGPVAAYDKFQQDKARIPPLAQVDIESRLQPQIFEANASASSIYAMREAGQAHEQLLLNPPKIDISDVIHAQESSGKPHDYQIQPGTFAQYAKEGESADNPQDHDAVYKRIITDLKQSYPDDPARQAVAYFSGKGNVAPAGSATPWLEDKQDANGKSVSSYVADIDKRMGVEAKPYATNQYGGKLTAADYYMTHRAEVIQYARNWAERQDPGNLKLSNAAVARVEQQMEAAIHDQNGQLAQYKNVVQRAYNGDLTKGKPPMTIDEMQSIPGVKDAMDNISVHDSTDFMRRLETNLTARNGGKEDKTLGTGYMDVLKGIHPTDGSTPSVTNENQVYDAYYNGKITDSGRQKLISELTSTKKDPAGAAALAAKTSLYDSLHKQISYQDTHDKNAPVYDPVGEARFAQALPLMDAQLQKNRDAGVPDDESFNSESRHYIGNAAKPAMRSPAEMLVAKRNAALHASGLNEKDDPITAMPLMSRLASGQIKGKDGMNQVISAYKSGKLSKDTATSLLVKYGYARKVVANETAQSPVTVPHPD